MEFDRLKTGTVLEMIYFGQSNYPRYEHSENLFIVFRHIKLYYRSFRLQSIINYCIYAEKFIPRFRYYIYGESTSLRSFEIFRKLFFVKISTSKSTCLRSFEHFSKINLHITKTYKSTFNDSVKKTSTKLHMFS